MSNDANPHYYTLGMAAKATGKSKSALLDAIRKGKFSVIDKTENGYKIDPAELHRVYPPVTQPARSEQNTEAQEIARLKIELKVVETELHGERLRLQDKEKQLEDVQKDRDHWRQQATYLLESRREEKKLEPSQSWFGKLLRRKP